MKISTSIIIANIATSVVFYCIAITLLYFVVESAVYQELDSSLYRKRNEITEQISRGHITLEHANSLGEHGSDEFIEIHKAQKTVEKPIIYSLHEPIRPGRPYQEYRCFLHTFSFRDTLYELKITRAVVEWRQIISRLVISSAILLLFLVLLIFWGNFSITQKVLRPFYTTLFQLQSIGYTTNFKISFPNTSINEIKELQLDLTRMLNQLEILFIQKSEYIQNASHELMTPLAILTQKAENLLQEPGLSEYAAGELADMRSTLSRIARLNNTLLLLEKIENRLFTIQNKINLFDCTQEVCAELSDFLELRNQQLKMNIAPDINLLCNKDLLVILIRNLLHNAIKYALEGSDIIIRVSTLTDEGMRESVIFQVDNLVANPDIAIESINFKRFARKSREWNDSPGLGLALVKSIAELHGWKVFVEFDESVEKNVSIGFNT
jgi:signal transduction histidine kinase